MTNLRYQQLRQWASRVLSLAPTNSKALAKVEISYITVRVLDHLRWVRLSVVEDDKLMVVMEPMWWLCLKSADESSKFGI